MHGMPFMPKSLHDCVDKSLRLRECGIFDTFTDENLCQPRFQCTVHVLDATLGLQMVWPAMTFSHKEFFQQVLNLN